jgi:GTP-binding protein
MSSRSIRVLRTNIPSIYTASPIEPKLDLSPWKVEAKRLFSLTPVFVLPAVFQYKYPTGNVPEFAFCGRSNVGKSSLIETLLGDQKIVRTSKTPGCTRSVNYFALSKSNQERGVSAHECYLVDLPGYGFAKAGKEEKQRWKQFIEGYLRTRPSSVLRRVYVLVDSRRGLKESDDEMMKLLDSCGLPYQVILTKADVTRPSEMVHAVHSVLDKMVVRRGSSALPFVHVVSSHTGEGIDDLKCSMTEIAAQKWVEPETPYQLL